MLSESAAILIHLGRRASATAASCPRDDSARAQAIRGLVFIAANCYAAISIIDYPERWCEDADEATQEAHPRGHASASASVLGNVRRSLSGASVSRREAIGALDLLAAVVSKWSGSRAHLQKARPAFYETLLRIEAHPKVAPVFAKHWPAK